MQYPLALLIAFLVAALSAAGAAKDDFRLWRSADGSRTMEARFLKLDGQVVSMVTRNGQNLSFTMDKLDAESQAAARAMAAKPTAPPEKLSVFETFTLGSSIEETTAAANKQAGNKERLPGHLFGRTGLNGIHSIEAAGLSWSLFFGFSPAETLVDVSLHGPELDPAEPTTAADLARHANAIQPLLVSLAGKPIRTARFPAVAKLADGRSEFYEVWNHQDRYYYLGIGKLDGKVCCLVRCTGQAPPTEKAPQAAQ